MTKDKSKWEPVEGLKANEAGLQHLKNLGFTESQRNLLLDMLPHYESARFAQSAANKTRSRQARASERAARAIERLDQGRKTVRVIIDPSDATKDRNISAEDANRLVSEGVLCYDVTNSCYTTKGVYL